MTRARRTRVKSASTLMGCPCWVPSFHCLHLMLPNGQEAILFIFLFWHNFKFQGKLQELYQLLILPLLRGPKCRHLAICLSINRLINRTIPPDVYIDTYTDAYINTCIYASYMCACVFLYTNILKPATHTNADPTLQNSSVPLLFVFINTTWELLICSAQEYTLNVFRCVQLLNCRGELYHRAFKMDPELLFVQHLFGSSFKIQFNSCFYLLLTLFFHLPSCIF